MKAEYLKKIVGVQLYVFIIHVTSDELIFLSDGSKMFINFSFRQHTKIN